MKVIKENDQSILLNYFGIQDKHYMVISHLVFFAFDDPKTLLQEQDLWKLVPAEIPDSPLDHGMPKTTAEVLVKGNCYATGGTPVPASEVEFRFGPVEKKLQVFGDRYWKDTAGVTVITDPEPFTEMPVDAAHAFGGPEDARNMMGKGTVPVDVGNDKQLLPLPNVELPGRLIGAPSDKPDPALFTPLDFMHPYRQKKLGTYDNTWFRTRFPYYPEDMDWTFFNAAPTDQWLPGYLKGGEPFECIRMHPDKPVVGGNVPRIRPRIFVFQTPDQTEAPHPVPADAPFLYKEIKMDMDTVWLFPHHERGILISRGMAEVMDSEALDVAVIHMNCESQADPAKPMEEYLAALRKKLDRAVDIDMEKIEAAKKDAEDIKVKVAEVKAKLEAKKDQLLSLNFSKPDPNFDPQALAAKMAGVLAGISASFETTMKVKDEIAPHVPVNKKKVRASFARMSKSIDKMSKVAAKGQALQAKAATKKAAAKAEKKSFFEEMLKNDKVPPQLKQKLIAAHGQKPVNPVTLKLNTPPPEVRAAGPKAVADYTIADMKKQGDALKSALAAKRDQTDEHIKKAVSKHGAVDADKMLAAAKQPPPKDHDPFAALKKGSEDNVKQVKASLKKHGKLTPDLEAKIDAQADKHAALLAKSKDRHDKGMAKLANMKALKEKGGGKLPLPEWAVALAAKHGKDLNDCGPLTREDVIQMHKDGKSLAGRQMSNLDLSNLDLSGADMKNGKLLNTNLQNTKLDGADLTKAKALEADLTGASLAGASIESAVFMKAKMPGANLSKTKATRAIFKDADLTEANFSEADATSAIFDGATCKKVNFTKAKVPKALLTNADFAESNFSEGDISGAKLFQSKMDKVVFDKATMHKTLIWNTQGETVSFKGADMFNSRIGGESELKKPDFTGITLNKAHWRHCDLPDADFTGSKMKNTTFDTVRMPGAKFGAIPAPATKFPKSDLTGADLKGANIHLGSFRKATLTNADLSNANLYGSEFMSAKVGDTNFKGANLKMTKLDGRTDLLPSGEEKS